MKANVGSAGLPVEWTTKHSPGLVQQFRWWHTRGKNKLQPQILESFLSPAVSCLPWLVQVTEVSRQLSLLHRLCYVSTINILLYNRSFSNQNYRNQPSEQKLPFHKRVVQAGLFWPP